MLTAKKELVQLDTVRMDTILHDSYTVTPSLILDFEIIRDTFHRFTAAFPGAAIDYAMKANANPQIIETLVELGRRAGNCVAGGTAAGAGRGRDGRRHYLQ